MGERRCAFLNGHAEFCRACGTSQWRCPSGICLYQSSLEIYIWEVTAIQMVVTPGSSFVHQGLFGEEEEPSTQDGTYWNASVKESRQIGA